MPIAIKIYNLPETKISQGGQVIKIIISFITFFSLTLLAGQQRFLYRNVTLINKDAGSQNCLQLDSVSIVDGKADESSVTLIAGNRGYSYDRTYQYQGCPSEDVCPAIVYFGNDEHSFKVTAARQNTASVVPGFKDLTIDVGQVPRFVSYYCVYSLAN